MAGGKQKELRERRVKKSTEYGPFFQELQKETDRAAAVLGAAMLDETLRQLLVAFLVDDEPETSLLIEGEQAGLGTFASRIRAAYCLGLISKEQCKALRLVKEIRNLFAHQLHGLSFADPEIAPLCRRLHEVTLYPKSPEMLIYSSPRMAFLQNSAILLFTIDLNITDKRKTYSGYTTVD